MKVSICSAILNHSEFLRPMIASVIGQSFKDWELIIVDDGSTEDIKSICEEWNDERIKYHRFPENKGVPYGINFALTEATGDYIGILSADERLDLNKLLWQVGYLDDHPEIAGIWGLPQNGELGERPEWEQYHLRAHNRSRQAWVRTLLNLESIPIGGASWLVRKTVLDDIGLFDPQFYTCSDLELFVRFFKKYDGVVMPYRWIWCEENPKALSLNVKQDDFKRDLMKVREKHAEPFMPVSHGSVTVAIPVHNMAKYLPQCIASLQAQTVQDFYIVLLDDASTDNTYQVMKELKDSRTSLMQFDENRGCSMAWNQMLGMCNTPFFMCLAADDCVDPTFIEKCLAEFKTDPWLEFVASQTDFLNEDGTPHAEPHPMKNIAKATNRPRDQWLHLLYYGNHYFGAGMYRTYAAKQVGGWDKDAGVLADYEMYLKLLQRENIRIIEEDLTHTRIHDGNRSILKTRAEQQKLREDYHKIRTRYYPPRMKVIIATPFYEMRGYEPYISSMVATVQILTRMGIENEFWALSGDSYIDRAKNTLVNKFLEDPSATDLFMIDADMQWNPQAFIDMVGLPEEIIMGSYPQKNSWDKWTATPVFSDPVDGMARPMGRELSNGAALLKAAYLAGGFIRIKRAALQKYKDHYKDYVYHDPGADPSYHERLYTEFFTCERANSDEGKPLRWGEDRVFGKRMKAIGVEGWIYPKVDFGHYGVKGWMGNFDSFLRTGAQSQ